MSSFDEYRGFVAMGQHLRADPSTKDVFVYSEFMSQGAGDATALPLNLHLIDVGEQSSHQIAFNYQNHLFGGPTPGHFSGLLLNNQMQDQKIIWVAKNELVAVPPPPFQYLYTGSTDSQLDAQGRAVLGPPWTVGTGSAVFMRPIRWISPPDQSEVIPNNIDVPKIMQTIAHEIGHNLAIDDAPHPQDTQTPPQLLCPPPAATVMVTDYFTQSTTMNCQWNNIPHMYVPTDLSQIRVK